MSGQIVRQSTPQTQGWSVSAWTRSNRSAQLGALGLGKRHERSCNASSATSRKSPEQRGRFGEQWSGDRHRHTVRARREASTRGRRPAQARQHGLFPAVAQQWDTGEVLMVGWMDDEALHRTLTTGRCTYWSRSRREYWVKGETSGHLQRVKSVALDCDGDTVLVKVDQVGARLPHRRPHLLRRRRAARRRSDRPTRERRAMSRTPSRPTCADFRQLAARPPGDPGTGGCSRTARPRSASTASSPASGPAPSCWSRPSTAGPGRATPSSACAPPPR